MTPGGTFDVAVVGAGPAGGSAALAAARAGARVVLLERARLPRYKRCGGGLMGLSTELLSAAGVDVEALTRARVHRLTCTDDGGLSRTLGWREPVLTMVERSAMDAALVEAAAAAGAEVRDGVSVTGLSEHADGVTLTVRDVPAGRNGETGRDGPAGRDARTVRARTVVGADGSAGRTGAYVGVRCAQVDLGLEGEYPVPAGSDWQDRVLLDWGGVPGSYGWLFPKGDRLTIGVIGTAGADGSPPLREQLDRLLHRLGVDPTAGEHVGGHRTRVRAPGSPLMRGRVLVAGDAAGLLEPWTREGISFALRSGRLAGRAAADGDLAGYPAAIAATVGAEIDAGRELLGLFTRHRTGFHLMLTAAGPWLFPRIATSRLSMASALRAAPVRAGRAALRRWPG